MTDISLSCNVHAFNSHARRKCSSGFLNISHLIHCHELSHYNETVLNIFLISGAVNPNNWSPTNIDKVTHCSTFIHFKETSVVMFHRNTGAAAKHSKH